MNGDTQPTGRQPALARALLRMPLYFKLIIANALITLGAVLTCATFVVSSARAPNAAGSATTWTIITIAVIVGIVVNSVVVHVALSPVRNLVAVAERIRAGDDKARATESVVSDAALADVATVFNSAMDSLAMYRVRLREIAIRAIDAGEAERSRLSRELHDDVAQSLAAVLLSLRTARSSAGDALQEPLAEIAARVSASINELRAMAHALRPPALDMIGLTAALQSHARTTSELTNVSVEARIENVNNLLAKEAELALYRLVQEALLNVVTHARTNAAIIEVKRSGNFVTARISDRGIGFDLGKAVSNGALGIFGMHERASYAGGQVGIESSPGVGTIVEITLPITESAHV
jgi:signal transduction histidine kinase